MEKRFLLALTLSLLVMIGYQYGLQKIYGVGKAQEPTFSSEPPALPPPPAVVTPQKPRKTLSLRTEGATFFIDEETASISEIRPSNQPSSVEKEAVLVKVENYDKNIGYLWFENPKINQIPWSKVEDYTHKASFLAETSGFRLKKSFSSGKTPFDLVMDIEITNESNQTLPLYYGLIGPSSLSHDQEDKRFFDLAASSGGKTKRFAPGKIQKAPIERRGESASWLSMQNKYFSLIAKTETPTGGYFVRAEESGDPYLGFLSRPLELGPGQTVQETVLFYAGPTALSELTKLGKWAEGTMNFGFFGGIAKFLLKGLLFLKDLTGSYGSAIILTTLCITVLFLPLSIKSYNSMSRMKLLQPEMAKLKELYKDKPQKLNKEVMALYRREKVNPLSGCLPVLFQMPIFIAFYNVLMKSIELKGTPFLFIKDLSRPDRVITLPFSVWPIGAAINLLPLLMVGAMLLQQRLSGPMVAASGAESEAQQMMTKVMPVMFGVFFYGLPSGLVLYWLTNTLLSIGTQRFFIKTAL